MRAVITVIGKDMVGILAKVATRCSECKVNIIDVSQTVMQELFCMIMMVDITEMDIEFSVLVDDMKNIGTEMGLSVHVMHEDIFNSMHRI